MRRFRVGHALVVHKSNRLLRRSTRLPAACFPKNPVAPGDRMETVVSEEADWSAKGGHAAAD